MRVALFHNLPPGGARRAAYELAKRSSPDIEYDFFGVDLGVADRFDDDPQRATQDVASLCRSTNRVSVPRGAHRRGVPLDVARAVDAVNVDRATRVLASAIDAGGYDLVLAHHDQLLHAPPILGRTRTPVVYYLQEPRRQSFEYNLSRRHQSSGVMSLPARSFDRWVARHDVDRTRQATAIVVNSYHSLESAYRAYGRHAFVCHLGVDENVFRPSAPASRNGMIAVGALHAMKGHELCIRELALLPPAIRPPLTVVYQRGTAEERAHLQRVADECKVELEFHTGISDAQLAQLYGMSVAALCVAPVEPFGLTTIEALACGTPVIAVSEGGYREVVRDGVNGVLVDRRPGRLASAVERIVEGELAFDAAGLRASVLPYYGWDEAARRMDAILESVANGERIPTTTPTTCSRSDIRFRGLRTGIWMSEREGQGERHRAQQLRVTARRLAAHAAATPMARSSLRRISHRGMVPETVWRHLPPGEATFDVVLPTGSFRYTVEPSDPFVRELYWRGMKSDEASSLAAFAAVAAEGGLVADVGAHTGLYTLAALAANPAVEVIAFEPVPANVDLLLRNLELNGWCNRCDVRQVAVSESSGRTRFHIPLQDHPMSGSLDPGGFRGLAGAVVDVESASLDDALEGRTVQLVKIDVEGFEDKVLAGATAVLRDSAPVIMIECNPDGPVTAVESTLRANGYRFMLLDETHGGPSVHIQLDPAERFRNSLCLPPGRADLALAHV